VKIITDRNDNNSLNRRIAAIAAIAGLVVVVAVMFLLLNGSEGADLSNGDLMAEGGENTVNLNAQELDALDRINEYTAIEADKETLISLVVDTINLARKRIEGDLSLNESVARNVLKPLVDAVRGGKDLNEPFDPMGGSDFDGWTYWDHAGMVGNYIFNHEDYSSIAEMPFERSEVMKQFVGNAVFDLKTDDLAGWELATPSGMNLADFDVNYELSFLSNGIKYLALVGNQDGKYVVLDVIMLSAPSIAADGQNDVLGLERGQQKNQQPQQAIQPVKIPAKTPANDVNAPTPENELEASPGEQMPIDYGPEGPKEGYVYVPGFGYIPITSHSEDEILERNPDGDMTYDKLSGEHSGSM